MQNPLQYTPDNGLTIADIMVKQVVFFDPQYESKCAEFCKLRGIYTLPDIKSLRSIHRYNRKKGEFSHKVLLANEWSQMVIKPDRFLFTEETRKAFERQDLLFVVEQEELLGVIHYSDYNSPPLYEQTYHRLYKLERGLLKLIELSGNFKRKNLFPKTDHAPEAPLTSWDFREEHKSLNDILSFANDHKLLDIPNVKEIKELRNRVAHSSDLILQEDYQRRDFIFDKASFFEVFQAQRDLATAIRQVYNKLYFLQLEL